ncbi:MAG: hypothetical protein NT062_03140 [Proteobacteria bacterium]|nr:hypothetical protein [Pseudomonadota bacterium]
MVFRSLVLGLLLAAIVLIVDRPVVAVAVPTAVEPDDRLRVIDVSSAMRDGAVAELVVLASGERISMVDDRPVDDPLEARARIAMRAAARGYIDVTIRGAFAADRRVLLLVH